LKCTQLFTLNQKYFMSIRFDKFQIFDVKKFKKIVNQKISWLLMNKTNKINLLKRIKITSKTIKYIKKLIFSMHRPIQIIFIWIWLISKIFFYWAHIRLRNETFTLLSLLKHLKCFFSNFQICKSRDFLDRKVVNSQVYYI